MTPDTMQEMSLEQAMYYFARKKPIMAKSAIPENWHSYLFDKSIPIDFDQKYKIEQNNKTITDIDLKKLEKLLLSFDGQIVNLPDIEEDIDNILKFGQLWNGWSNTIFMKGSPSQCHRNATDLYYANYDNPDIKALTIATGYAMSNDGIWRQHSWLLRKNPRSISIIETTEKQLLYFGFAMSDDILEDFLYYNS